MKARFEHSAGGVVYRLQSGEPEIALAARRTRAGDLAWGLPKGIIEPGEDAEETAAREVLEETGLEARITRPLGDVTYWFVWDDVRVKKTVTLFLMEALGGDIAHHDDEMEDVRWFPATEAVRQATFRTEREILQKAVLALAGQGDPPPA